MSERALLKWWIPDPNNPRGTRWCWQFEECAIYNLYETSLRAFLTEHKYAHNISLVGSFYQIMTNLVSNLISKIFTERASGTGKDAMVIGKLFKT